MVHKFYISTTDITYNAKSKHLEIIMKCFVDDFDKSLESFAQQKVFIGTVKEHPKSDSLIRSYVQQHFMIHQENKLIEVNVLGFETDQDYIWLYVESGSFNKKLSTQITNTILFDSFEEQQNKVRLLVGEKSYSGRCIVNSPNLNFEIN